MFERIMKFATVLRKMFPARLWHQILLVLVLWVMVPLVILGGLLIQTSQRAIKTSVLRDYKEIALRATGEVSEKINGAQQSLIAAASILGTLHADPWRQETTIVQLALESPIYQRISSVGLSGQEISTSELGTPLYNRSPESAFRSALEGKTYVSEVRISDDHMPVMTVAVPIKELGYVTGVLMADLNLRGIWDIVDSIVVGQTGRAYLVDQNGRIIAHQDKKLVLENAEPVYPEVVRRVLDGNTGSLEEHDRHRQGWLVSYAPVKNLNWGLVIEQSTREAYAFLGTMEIQSWALIFLSIFAAILVSVFLSRFMSQPINNLIDGTRRLAQGDFTHSFRISRRDEMGRLLFSFNRMTTQLRKAQQVERLSVVGRAATTIAHELKNSLVLIRTFIQLLPERHKDQDFIKEFSETIPKELDSWNTMLQNMMEFSKNAKWTMEPVNIHDAIEDVVDLAKLRAAQRNITLKAKIDDSLPLIEGNADKLKQAFLNLMTNSIEATPPGGSITVSTRLLKGSRLKNLDYLEIQFSNTGEGIAPEHLEQIFEPFFTTKDNGLGLGLAISNEIIKRHDGEIRVASEKEKDTAFIILLPANAFRPVKNRTAGAARGDET
jgi:signal transduction histidine kinase